MAAEELLLLDLFDSNWFGQKPELSSESHQEKKTAQGSDCTYDYDQEFSFSVPKNLKVRSLSEQLLDSNNKLGSFFSSPGSENSLSSPISVLPSPKLQTIFSGKEAKDDSLLVLLPGEASVKEEGRVAAVVMEKKEVGGDESERKRRSRRRRGNRGSKLGGGFSSSKSLSELEFEELKGFMDLGFVFTEEECRDSKLVSMIPGLQRFCRKGNNNDHVDHHNHHRSEDDDHDHDHKSHDEGCDDHHVISRPYLSEAWDVLESERNKKKDHQILKKPLMVIDLKIQALSNEICMKDQLKFWAHSVASTVR